MTSVPGCSDSRRSTESASPALIALDHRATIWRISSDGSTGRVSPNGSVDATGIAGAQRPPDTRAHDVSTNGLPTLRARRTFDVAGTTLARDWFGGGAWDSRFTKRATAGIGGYTELRTGRSARRA